MGLQRTPPQRVQPLPGTASATPALQSSTTTAPLSQAPPALATTEPSDVSEQMIPPAADKSTISLPTPSRAFVPRNQKVLRTPPGGGSPLPPTATPNQATHQMELDEEARDEAAVLMDIDEPNPPAESESDMPIPVVQEVQPVAAPPPREVTPEPSIPVSTTPTSAPIASTSQIHATAPTTPGAQRTQPKTPRSRSRRATSVLPDPPAPIQIDADDQSQYGRRYQLTMETLDRAIKAGVQRWTVETFKGCFPKISQEKPKAMENVYHNTAQAMRDAILGHAHASLRHYKAGPALQAIDEVDKEARAYAKANPESGSTRPDAWRPNISPNALVAATTLPIYDEAYAKLREEYLGLHQDISERFTSIKQKQALLKDLESNVSDGVVDLEKTIQVLDKLPVDDMSLWMETAETRLDTRAAERTT